MRHRNAHRLGGFAVPALLPSCLAGCSGIQSALEPAGEEAASVFNLFWFMFSGGAIIWLGVVALVMYASRARQNPHSERASGLLILWGGAIFPSAVLALLLGFTFWLMPGIRPWTALADAPQLRIEVVGEQFWWRVTYFPGDGSDAVVSANEIRLPVGQRVEFTLKSNDVIHSFWIPSLGGKMDMIPGRTNRLSLLATKPGIFRGPCAEYCGTSHALMAFSVVAMEPMAFGKWLSRCAKSSENVAAAGSDAFLANGCGACHTIKGTEATGVIGPDLSHVGSRRTLGAGILPNNEATIARFITEPDRIKPGVQMPAFGMLPHQDIETIAAYLKGLK
ncbi:cytochrome c oxidase subunit II [Pseudaminobacter arsenicus]|uniref:Cytochrome aa3 subunit 2 n=2 Tax=Borborobacter arsenicus TaxID=1851146 RepID=A0A432UZ86_9HYPH|nr:cytochrome c oxidase subunit II [Pseudaminobacter arsenicus]